MDVDWMEKIDAVGYTDGFQVPAVRKRYLYWLINCFCESWATKIPRGLFPYKCLYSKVTQQSQRSYLCLASNKWICIDEDIDLFVCPSNASTASCLYWRGAALWNRLDKRQSPSLNLLRTLRLPKTKT